MGGGGGGGGGGGAGVHKSGTCGNIRRVTNPVIRNERGGLKDAIRNISVVINKIMVTVKLLGTLFM